MANHLNDHFQLCAAALCLEERTDAALWEIHHQSAATKGDLTLQLREATEQAIAAAQMAKVDASAHRASQVSGMQLTGNLPAV